jgi:hypothetical protein
MQKTESLVTETSPAVLRAQKFLAFLFRKLQVEMEFGWTKQSLSR